MGLTKNLLSFTEKHFEDFVRRDERRKELESEARALGQQNKLVLDDLFKALKDNNKTEFVRGAYVGAIETKKGTVSWKDEFLKVAGAEVAAEISANVEHKEFATIAAV